MKKTKIIIIATFLVVFGAGIAAGRFWASTQKRPSSRESWLAAQLKLDSDQKKQVEEIWKAVRVSRKAQTEQRKALADARETGVLNLLTEEQKVEYAKLIEEFDEARADMAAEREIVFNQAVANTKSILRPEQREKYEQLLAKYPKSDGK